MMLNMQPWIYCLHLDDVIEAITNYRCETCTSEIEIVNPTYFSDSLPFLTRTPRPEFVNSKLLKPTTDKLIQVLEDVRIDYILSRFSLDSTCEWSSVLSLGEQQRLAFARLLLSKPYLVLLDESTSALDEANEVIVDDSSLSFALSFVFPLYFSYPGHAQPFKNDCGIFCSVCTVLTNPHLFISCQKQARNQDQLS